MRTTRRPEHPVLVAALAGGVAAATGLLTAGPASAADVSPTPQPPTATAPASTPDDAPTSITIPAFVLTPVSSPAPSSPAAAGTAAPTPAPTPDASRTATPMPTTPDSPTSTASPASPTSPTSPAGTPAGEPTADPTPSPAPWTPTVVDSAPATEAAGGQAATSPDAGWPNLAPPFSSVPVSAPAPAAPTPADRSFDPQVVQRGDSLWTIAARHLGPGASDAQIAAEWPRWWAANRAVIGSDPNILHVGEQLQPPAAA
ncbi:LysM domain-containing protein [Pseudofrankia sp. DC12]|uniref:LysM peptidoglycan-binding domain-containing protein n=1 Tax=Pseudofrankia sp. DC12 TaxID=683315 RepID=UPI00069747AB|nr:LysM domain-containing protein [Pseudofrankia sp. DC12]